MVEPLIGFNKQKPKARVLSAYEIDQLLEDSQKAEMDNENQDKDES